MAWSSKRTILAQEGLSSRDLPWYQKARYLSDLTARMQFSGYEKKFHFEIISSTINTYETLRGNENEGERPLYCPRTWNAEEHMKECKDKKKTWYKKDD